MRQFLFPFAERVPAKYHERNGKSERLTRSMTFHTDARTPRAALSTEQSRVSRAGGGERDWLAASRAAAKSANHVRPSATCRRRLPRRA